MIKKNYILLMISYILSVLYGYLWQGQDSTSEYVRDMSPTNPVFSDFFSFGVRCDGRRIRFYIYNYNYSAEERGLG